MNTVNIPQRGYVKMFFLYILPIINVFFYINTNIIKDFLPADIIYALLLILAIFYFYLLIFKITRDIIIKLLQLFSLMVLIMGLVTFIIHDIFPVKSLKILISNHFYLFGFFIVRTRDDFKEMLKGNMYAFAFFLINIAVYNIFNIGGMGGYGIKLNFNFGGQNINTVQILPFFFLSSLFFLQNVRVGKTFQQIAIITMMFVSIFILIFSSKRGSLLAVIFGLIYFLFTVKPSFRTLLIILLVSAGCYFLYNKYNKDIQEVYKEREERLSILTSEDKLKKEGRYQEIILILNEFEKKPFNILFGNGIGAEYFIKGNSRMIHSDYSFIFYSMGLIGLLIFICIYLLIYKKCVWFKRFKILWDLDSLDTLVMLMLIVLIFVGISGSLHVIQIRALAMFCIGGAFGLLDAKRLAYKSTGNTKKFISYSENRNRL